MTCVSTLCQDIHAQGNFVLDFGVRLWQSYSTSRGAV
ncbi:MAG: hypothetical protein KatS3mg004_3235 [Bryobacteraceae bacterium]|nr:MAG: hypothetical protein KatS3mg004_3235 [Bryobacteraceae bacterium]